MGWLIIFAIISMTSGVWGSSAQTPAGLLVSGLCGFLFLLGLGARSLRDADY